MDTFSSLNTRGSTQVAYTENRPKNVIFSYPNAFDIQTSIIGVYTFDVQNTIDILEVIKPAETNVSYTIDVSGITGATVYWPTQPPGKTITESNGIYIISPINSAAEWEQIKNPILTIPNTFNGSISYTATITYTDSIGIQTKQWTVGKNIPITNPVAEFNLSCTPSHLKGPSDTVLDVYTNMFGNGFDLVLLEGASYLDFGYIDDGYFVETTPAFDSAFSLSCVPIAFEGSQALLDVTASINCVASVDLANGSDMNVATTLTCDAVNLNAFRTDLNSPNTQYKGNNRNSLYTSYTDAVTAPDTGATYKIVYTLSSYVHGYLQNRSTPDTLNNSLSTSITLEGTKTQVNTAFANGIYFYPFANTTSSQSLTIQSYVNGALKNTSIVTLTFDSYDNQPRQDLEFLSNTTFYPNNLQYLYMEIENAIMVGAGGAGTTGGGGAGSKFGGPDFDFPYTTPYSLNNVISTGLVFTQGTGTTGAGGDSTLFNGAARLLVAYGGGAGVGNTGGNSFKVDGSGNPTLHASGGSGIIATDGSGDTAGGGGASNTAGGNASLTAGGAPIAGTGASESYLGGLFNVTGFIHDSVAAGGNGVTSTQTTQETTSSYPGSGGPATASGGTQQIGANGACYLHLQNK